MDYTRQSELVQQEKIAQSTVSLIGCGAIGSAVAMTLAKMGVNYFHLYDEDGVNIVNLPNQMYSTEDLGAFKVDALARIIKEYNPDAVVTANNKNYHDQKLTDMVVVATDSMSSRQQVWTQFCVQQYPLFYIEARMGAEEGQVYTIKKINTSERNYPHVKEEDKSFYHERLYPDTEAKQAPCTAKAIIYNVFMVAALVCRAYKAVIEGQAFPREAVFGMAQIHKYSFQIRD